MQYINSREWICNSRTRISIKYWRQSWVEPIRSLILFTVECAFSWNACRFVIRNMASNIRLNERNPILFLDTRMLQINKGWVQRNRNWNRQSSLHIGNILCFCILTRYSLYTFFTFLFYDTYSIIIFVFYTVLCVYL